MPATTATASKTRANSAKPDYESFLPRKIRTPKETATPSRRRQPRGYWADFIEHLPEGEPTEVTGMRGVVPESFRPSIYAAAQKVGAKVGIRHHKNKMFVVRFRKEDQKKLAA